MVSPDLCTLRRSDSCVNSAANRGRAGMDLQLVDNTGISVHRILCTDLQEATDTAIASGSRIFIGSQKEFCKAAMGAGFVLAARFQGNHAGDSRVSSSAVNSRRIQNGVHNSGITNPGRGGRLPRDVHQATTALQTATAPPSTGHDKGTSMNRIKRRAAACQTIDESAKRVLRALEEETHGCINANDPIMEQLKQCPEAFKVGEILGKAFDSLKHAQDGSELGDRYLPPSGVVIPPLV